MLDQPYLFQELFPLTHIDLGKDYCKTIRVPNLPTSSWASMRRAGRSLTRLTVCTYLQPKALIVNFQTHQ